MACQGLKVNILQKPSMALMAFSMTKSTAGLRGDRARTLASVSAWGSKRATPSHRTNSSFLRPAASRSFTSTSSKRSPKTNVTVDRVYIPHITSSTSASPAVTGMPRIPLSPRMSFDSDGIPRTDKPSTSAISSSMNLSGAPMKPQIYSVAASSGASDIPLPSAISEVTDNESINIDPYELTWTVGESKAAAEASMRSRSDAELVNGHHDRVSTFMREAWNDVRSMWESNLEGRVQ